MPGVAEGSYGVYFWEIFCHLPLTIAAQLNARGKYEDADWWLRRVWDPFHHDPGSSPESSASLAGSTCSSTTREWGSTVQFTPSRLGLLKSTW